MCWPAAARRDASVSRSDARPGSRAFPREARISSRKQYLDIYARGHRLHSAYFVVFGVASPEAGPRLGITATKKFGPAVARNRIKRVVREIFRHHRDELTQSVDIVVNVKAAAREQTKVRLESDLSAAMRELSRRLRA